jgi:hypothetical protein
VVSCVKITAKSKISPVCLDYCLKNVLNMIMFLNIFIKIEENITKNKNFFINLTQSHFENNYKVNISNFSFFFHTNVHIHLSHIKQHFVMPQISCALTIPFFGAAESGASVCNLCLS